MCFFLQAALPAVCVFVNLKFVLMKMCHLIAFASGIMLGGAAALLFAPKKGEDLRKDIKNRLNDVKREIAENAVVCREGYCKREDSQNE